VQFIATLIKYFNRHIFDFNLKDVLMFSFTSSVSLYIYFDSTPIPSIQLRLCIITDKYSFISLATLVTISYLISKYCSVYGKRPPKCMNKYGRMTNRDEKEP